MRLIYALLFASRDTVLDSLENWAYTRTKGFGSTAPDRGYAAYYWAHLS